MGPSKAQSALREPTCYFTPGSGSGQWWKWTIAGDSWAGQHTTWQKQQQNCRRDDYSLVKQWPACFLCLLTGLTLSLWIETDLVHETWELGRDKTYDNQHCWWLHSECSLQYKIDYTVTTEGVSSEKVHSGPVLALTSGPLPNLPVPTNKLPEYCHWECDNSGLPA